MAKDPAINWYFDNWGGGTFGMSRFHKGCYMDLLSAQYHMGHLSLEQIKNILGNDFSAWQILKIKFAQDENKNFFNERLATEVRKREKYSESRSKNRKKTHDEDMNNISKTHDCIYNETGIETGIGIFEKYEKLFFDLTANEINNSIEYLHRVTQKQFSLSELQNFWEGFKIQYSKDFHPNRNEVIKHFRNCIKKDQVNGHANHSTGNRSNRDKQSSANADLINDIRGIITG